MIKDAIILGLVLLLALLALGTAERPEAVIDAPMVKADWPICVRLNPRGPLIRPRHSASGNRLSEMT